MACCHPPEPGKPVDIVVESTAGVKRPAVDGGLFQGSFISPDAHRFNAIRLAQMNPRPDPVDDVPEDWLP